MGERIFSEISSFAEVTDFKLIYCTNNEQSFCIMENTMLNDYFPLFVIFIVALAVGVIVLLIDRYIGPKRPTVQKGRPYESGMIPFGEGTRQVNIRFYLTAVLFILFDVEVIFLLPWAVTFRSLGLSGFIEMFVFVAILVVGFVYVWKKGALEWE
jgi:NADH-quinone oxidoreductase subunit A